MKYLAAIGLAYAGSRFVGDVRGHVPTSPAGFPGIYQVGRGLSEAVPVTDGKWEAREWENDTYFRNPGPRSTFRSKYYEKGSLNVAVVHHINTEIDKGDFMSIQIDSKHDGALRPQKDDLNIVVIYQDSKDGAYDVNVLQGTGTKPTEGEWKLIPREQWEKMGIKVASALGSHPFKPYPGLIYEYEIPMSLPELGINMFSGEDQTTMGFNWLGSDMHETWSGFSQANDVPNTWLDFTKVDQVIPEFPYAKELVAATSLLGALELIRRRKNELSKLNYRM